MNHNYDVCGWYVNTTEGRGDRSTTTPPPVEGWTTPKEVGKPYPNWVGDSWKLIPYDGVEPAGEIKMAEPTEGRSPVDGKIWWINVGPFKDRLGIDGLAIGGSDHPVCKACIQMLNGRLYIDLEDPSVRGMLELVAANAQPAASPIFPGAGPLTEEKINKILKTPTTEAERYVKGLG